MKALRAVFLPEMAVKVISGEHEGLEGVIKSARDYVMIETKDFILITVEYQDVRFVYNGSERSFWTKYVALFDTEIYKLIRYMDEETANAVVAKLVSKEYASRELYSYIKVGHNHLSFLANF